MVADSEGEQRDRNCTLGEGMCAGGTLLRTAVHVAVDRRRREGAGEA